MRKGPVVITTVNIKDWSKFQESVKKELNRKEVYDKEHIRLIQNAIDDNYECILGITYDDDNDDNNKKGEEKTKREEFVTFKYSQMGKGEFHEAVIVNGLPFFLKYSNELNTFELLENIPENSRLLRPPNIEEYPYKPYSFESNEELQFFCTESKTNKIIR